MKEQYSSLPIKCSVIKIFNLETEKNILDKKHITFCTIRLQNWPHVFGLQFVS